MTDPASLTQGNPNKQIQALLKASSRGNEKAVQFLLEQGADVNAQSGFRGNALQAASSKGHGKVVQLLLEKGANVNAQGGYYSNALQAASSKGHGEVVQLLLEKGAEINAQGGYYGNALHAASSKGHGEVVQLLLEQGADVNAQSGFRGNALQAASSKGHGEVVQLLLEKGASVNAQGGEHGNALQAASSKGHGEVVQLLLEKGAEINAQGGYYGNALHAASSKGHGEVVQLLLEKGANVDGQGGFYGNPLHTASCLGNEEVVQLLLEKGANVNAQGGRYGNALQAALFKGHKNIVQLLLENEVDVNAEGGEYGNALQAASYLGHEKVVQLLLKKGANVNAQGGRYGNALQAALSQAHKNIVQLLLENGAAVNAQGGEHGNALQAASYLGHEKMVQLLLKKGANVNAQGGFYGNALQAASFKSHKDIMQLLLENGADVNAQGGYYGNALQAASFKGYEKDLQLLLENRADVNAQGGYYGNALQAASSEGYEKVVQLLFENGAEVNAQGGYYGNALQAASSKVYEKVLQLLLENGAEVKAQGGYYGNALQAASSEGYEKVVQLLLENGADVNAQGGYYGNALQAASFKGYEKVLQLLPESGAEVNAQGGYYGNALQAASSRGYEKVIQLLLENGAEVNAQGGYYGNALQAASSRGYEKVIQLLLENGADIQKASHQVAAESDIVPNETTDVSTDGNSSESGFEIMSDDDKDVEFGDSTPLKYDSPLASLRDRISKPVEYFERLDALTHLVYEHSTLRMYGTSYSLRMTVEEQEYLAPNPRYPESLERFAPAEVPRHLSDSDVTRICQDVSAANRGFASALFEILQCRNVNAQTYSNLRTLQSRGFCSYEFSMLAIDPSRHDVVRLIPIDIKRIQQLLEEIESVLRKVADFAMQTPSSTISSQVLLQQALKEHDDLLLSIPCSMGFLDTLGLVLAIPSVARTNLSILAVLRLVVNTIDLAVASYAGAHLDRFDEKYLGEDVAVIDVLDPFAQSYKVQIPSIKLRRCQLQCLDMFHKSQFVWVFSSSDWEPHARLLLSTKIEDFADIWGPLWKVVNPKVPNSYTRYTVGNGYIYKWKPHVATTSLLENETLCHWVSNTTIECGPEGLSSTEQLIFSDRLDEDFDGNENLLIGAVAAGSEILASNRDCKCNVSRSRSVLHEKGRVQMLGVVQEHTYKDSETHQLQVGHSGINASAARQYKRRGQSLKQAFVELWTTTPEIRDPQRLQDYCGLEISLCTQNAQRVQLGRILGFSSMYKYLRSFSWTTDGAKQAYFDSLKRFREDGIALQQSWERHDQYREDFGLAVLVCLKALEKTGINHNGQLGVFLSSEVTARPELIAMEREEHDWIGILKDSEDSCCMALIGDECLEFRYRDGAKCGRSGRSVLRTALVINRRNKPSGIKRKPYSQGITGNWTERWSVRGLNDPDIWLGTHGTLRLQSHLRDATLLMDWRKSDIITRVVRSRFNKEKPHREYIEDIQKEARDLRPVPLFVMARKVADML